MSTKGTTIVKATVLLLSLAAAIEPVPVAARPQHPRWPTVVVQGQRLLRLFRRGVLVTRPVEARADRVIVQLRPQWVRMVGFDAGRIQQALGLPLARYWRRLDMVSVRVPSDQLWQTLDRLRRHPAVESADLDYLVYPAYEPDTPEYREQYHHGLIQTPAAWDVLSPGEWREAVVAMVDTGLDLDHPDMVGRVWTNADEIPNNGIDDDANGFVDDVYGWDFYNGNNDPNPEPDGQDENYDGEPDEQVSHGTLGAGLVGAKVYDEWGTAGVYPNARIMAIQVFPDDGGTDYQTVVDGIEYAIDNGAEIINLSVGAPWSTVFTRPIVRAHRAGIVVVAAAGNYNEELTDSYWWSPVCNEGHDPLNDNYVIGVAYTDRRDRKGTYSNYDGSTPRHFVDVSAPGDRIYGPAYYDPSVRGFDQYFYHNTGTSFSTPLVSGLAALIKALHPAWTPDEIRDRITATADDIDRFNPGFAGKLGAGRINCARALGVGLGPRPPENLRAEDTPQDNGGSITVSWTLSPDDGAGANSVVAYKVLRAQNLNGTFEQVAEVPAGQDHYEDRGVEDGFDYYYKVGATDGTATAYAGPVGPVQSSDNLAPPMVTELVAQDRPGDQGGAIELSWTAYAPPADCTGYRVYRDQYPFDYVGGRTPIAEIPDPATKTYTDSSVLDFTDYYYAVTAVDEAGNENQNVQAVGPVQSIPNTTMTIQPGTHLLSAPVVPADGDPATLFGTSQPFRYARWDRVAGSYALYEPGGDLTAVLRMGLGRGFWLWTEDPLEFELVGQTASEGDWAVDVAPGWELVGNPYFATMDWAASQVDTGTTVMSLLAAEEDGYLSATIYTFDPAAYSYQMISPSWTESSPIPPWTGFWVRVYRRCTLTLKRPADAASAGVGGGTVGSAQLGGQARRGAGGLRWKIRLSAVGSRGSDRDNFVGVAATPVKAAPEPPPAPDTPQLWIELQGERCAAVALRPASKMTWRVCLLPAAGDERTWIEAAVDEAVAREYAIILRDLDSDRAVDLRRQRRVEVVGSTQRRFVLVAERVAGKALTVTTMSVQPGRAGAQVVFALSAPAYCDIEVLNIAGRPVRRIVRDKMMAAGRNVVVWDGKGQGGAPVPRGLYLIRLRARAEDGTAVQALRSVALHR